MNGDVPDARSGFDCDGGGRLGARNAETVRLAPGKPLCGIVPVTGDQQMPERGFPNHVDDRRLYNGHILIPCQPAVDVMLEDRPRRC